MLNRCEQESDRPPTEAIDPATSETLLVRRFTLRVAEGPDAGVGHTYPGTRISIGTHPANDFCLTDPAMSRFHCEIELREGRALVRDLGSRNGTRVDGVPILTGLLRRGSCLQLGRTSIRIEPGKDRVEVALSPRTSFGSAVGRSWTMRALFARLERVASSDVTVLLCGETGTGKDVLAESIHRQSARADGPFVVVDCGALPASLLASELFGHARGAFTGADRTRIGAAEAACRGTLFLDEIGELDLDLQPKLLRLLERREVVPVGMTRPVPVDVRVIAATSRNLRREVNQGKFRSDLYYRFAVVEANVPPLRERMEDLPLLVEALLHAAGVGDTPSAMKLRDPNAIARMARHDWPGNVRELRNYLERCLALDEAVAPADDGAQSPPIVDPAVPLRPARERWICWFERRYLSELLRHHGDNVSAAARAAGIDRVYMHRLLRKAGLR